MTTSNDAKTPSSAQKSQPPKGRPAPLQHQVSSNKTFQRPHRPINALIIALIAISTALYAIYSNVQLRQEITQRTNTLLTEIHALNEQQTDNKTLFDTMIKTSDQSESNLRDKLNVLEKQLQSTLQQRLYQSNNWLLLKARYCLELAQINAHWSDSSDATIALLQQANDLLAPLQDQQSFNVRQAITKEILLLQSRPTLDITGLLSQLDAAQDLIVKLPLKPIVPVETHPTITINANPSTWRAYLNNSISLLEKLVIIRHHDEAILPLPSPTYESILRESIRLTLQQAQWGVLHQNEAVYQRSLTQAIQQISRTFKSDTTVMNLITHKLQTLTQTHLAQQKPVLNKSLLLLNQFIESKDTPIPTTKGDQS